MLEGADKVDRLASLEKELAELRGRERALTELVENASIGLNSLSPEGVITWGNQAEFGLLGYTEGEYIGHRISDFHDDPLVAEALLQQIRRGESPRNLEARLRAKDGGIRHVLINADGVWKGDRLLYARCFTRDITARKESQERLQHTHEMLQALVQSSPLPIIVFQTDGCITLWNAAAERIFGWSAAEVLGGPIPFVPPDKQEEHRAMRAQDLQGTGFTERELIRRRKDGSTICVRVSTAPLRNAAGAITGIVSVYVDVTQRRQYEQRLLAQYGVARILAESPSFADAAPRLLQTFCESIGWRSALLWTPRPDGECLVLTSIWQKPGTEGGDFEKLCRNTTFAPGSGLPGRIWASREAAWLHDLSTDTNFPRLTVAWKEGIRSGFGFPILLGDTVFGVVECFSDEFQAPDADLAQLASTIGYQAGEFVERQRAQHILADRERSYRVLTETASDGIIAINRASKILFANSSSGRIFGYSREELIGADLTTLMPGYLRQVHLSGLHRYIETGKRHLTWESVQVPGLHRDGHEVPLEISFAEYEQEGSHVFIAIVRDITERKRMDEKLRQTAKLESVGLLAGGIAHDFNNLLTGIIGNISLASDSLSAVHPAKVTLKAAAEASERAAHLTQQLLAYAGKGRFVIKLLDISELAKEITTLVKAAIPKSVQLRLDLKERLPCVEGDPTQIQQLIMNLVINGGEAIAPGADGTVLITTGVQEVDQPYIDQTFGGDEIAPGRYVSLEVHDTGIGMDQATMAHIFDPFFTTKFTGRGLGLAAVLGIVRGHKGALKIYSTPGKGSTFKVLFPAVDGDAAQPAKGPAHDKFAGTGKVLVVDDEPIVRKVVKSMLERFGFDVVLAENGLEAVDLFARHRDIIDLVILDLTMPLMTGEEALRQIKVINPNVPILLSSGYNEIEAIHRFAGKGLAGFIQKPYSAGRLAEMLKTVLGSA